MIPSPYNFVPLSPYVFFPDWADKVSMDMPFRDGISGTLDIKVTTKTPTFIRNGDKEDKSFFRVTENGKYAIPGTSFKGMLRNVVEIISFSKIAGSDKNGSPRVTEHKYAIRDLYYDGYTSKITEKAGKGFKPSALAGWLREDEAGNWSITPCDFARVEQTDLENYEGTGKNSFGKKQSAVDKYQTLRHKEPIKFACDAEKAYPHNGGKIFLVYKKVKSLGIGDKKGVIVLTGQPTDREKMWLKHKSAKHMEFIFFDFDKPQPRLFVSEEVKEDFKFIHSKLGEKGKANEEWEFWQGELAKGKPVPVFFLLKDRSREIGSMGLALMYRLAYDYSIHDAIGHTSKDHLDGSRMDLSEVIFGRVEGTQGLKGRVAVETLVADGEPESEETVKTVLGTPRPTYYPNYVKQFSGKNGEYKTSKYKTFMDGGCEIRGWKRYIVKKAKDDNPPAAPTENVAVYFSPLQAGTVFRGTMHVHNLKPCELGALYWALTFGGDNQCCHSLGMAKPYGYGAVKVSVKGDLHGYAGNAVNLDQCMSEFIKMMDKNLNDKLNKSLIDTEQVQALLKMANPNVAWPQCTDAIYPTIDRNVGITFAQFKDKSHGQEVLAPWNSGEQQENKPKNNKQKVKPLKEQPQLKGFAKIEDTLKKTKMFMNVKDIKKLFKENETKESDLSAEQKAQIKPLLQKFLKIRFDGALSDYISKYFI